MPQLLGFLFVGLLLHGFAAPHRVSSQERVTFSDDIRPIMRRSCWNCHGAAVQLSGLDLSSREAAIDGGDRGSAIVPGRAEESLLFRHLAGLDEPRMPMEGDPISRVEVEAVRQWINDGAHWDSLGATTAAEARSALEDGALADGARDYWAFQLPRRSPIPSFADLPHPVDRFLESKRREHGLVAATEADKATLVRRAYLDLLGLPPTPEQAEAFFSDTERGAWERLIDELLDSRHYGERWGRHWLDVARYADSSGFEHDFDRPNAWRYRDYVIDAFNEDKPYNQFIREQVAGDELDYVTDETRVATGFLRAGPRVLFREKDNPERRHDYLDDIIATLGRGVLGLTVHCARCHDHKFDPIPQKDYYRLQASIFGYVETEHPLLPPDEAKRYLETVAEIDARRSMLSNQIDTIEGPYRERLKLERLKEKFPENVRRAVLKPASERTPGETLLATQVLSVGVPQTEVDALISPADASARAVLREAIDAIEATRPSRPEMAEIVTDGDYRFSPMGEGDEIVGCPECRIPPDEPGTFLHEGPGPYRTPPSHFLVRGDPFSKGSMMSPGFVSVATYGEPETVIERADGKTSGRRLALAQWLTSPDNPLTARVMVNRIWHHHFGRGIVATLDNFGSVGDRPSHPELLDWLAIEFADRGYSVKQMHRLLMTSNAYRMASATGSASGANDPENRFLWHFRARRLEAEIVRDAIMSTSGAIDLSFGGPPVFPFVPEEVLRSQAHGTWRNQPDGPEVWRRSVYVYRRRSLGFPFFDTFDLPDQNVTAAARDVSTVPTQALTLLNNPFVLRQAQLFASRLEQMSPNDPTRQIELAYRIALTRPPTAKEATIAQALVSERSLNDLTHVLFNLNEFLYQR